MQYWIVNKIVCDTEKAADETKTEDTEVPSTVKGKGREKADSHRKQKISRYEIAKEPTNRPKSPFF